MEYSTNQDKSKKSTKLVKPKTPAAAAGQPRDGLTAKFDEVFDRPGTNGHVDDEIVKYCALADEPGEPGKEQPPTGGPCGVEIEAEPVGDATGAVVTVYRDGEPLLRDRIDIARENHRTDLAARIASLTGEDASTIEQTLLHRAIACRQRRSKPDDAAVGADEPSRDELLAETDPAVVAEAREMLRDRRLLPRMLDDVAKLGVAGERGLVASLMLVGVSRLLPRPLAAIIQAPSSSGKSYTQTQVGELLPPEAIINATDLTAQALYYMQQGTLSHRLVMAGERTRRQDDDAADAKKALREMISSGKLSKLLTVTVDGQPTTRRIEQEGPIAYVESTTASNIFHEDSNRCLLLTTDERESQSRVVVTRIAEALAGGAASHDREAIIAKHHAMQRLLSPRPVLVPYAAKIAEKFPVERIECRRGIGHLFGLVQAHALLHQFQREIDSEGRIVATIADYAAVRPLLLTPLSRLLGSRVSSAAIRFHCRLVAWVGAEAWTTTQAARKDKKATTTVRDWLHELSELGVVEQVEPRRGSRPAVWRLIVRSNQAIAAMGIQLPKPEDLR